MLRNICFEVILPSGTRQAWKIAHWQMIYIPSEKVWFSIAMLEDIMCIYIYIAPAFDQDSCHKAGMGESLQCEAPKIAKLVYNSNNYGLWYL
jgi:hypothetical protein